MQHRKREPAILVQQAYSCPERLNDSLYYLFDQFCQRRGLILLLRNPEKVDKFRWSVISKRNVESTYFTLQGEFLGLDYQQFVNGYNPRIPVVWSQINWSKAYIIFNVEKDSESKDKEMKSLEERDAFFEFAKRK